MAKKRVSLIERARRSVERDKMVELREMGIPVRIIAMNVGKSQSYVAGQLRQYYHHKIKVCEATQEHRRYEHRMVLEANCARLAHIIAQGPEPAKLAAAGFQFRDWLAAMEEVRRFLHDLAGLDGLYRPMEGPGKGDPALESADKHAAALAVWQWVQSLKDTQPDLYQIISDKYMRAYEDAAPPGDGGLRGAVQAGGADEAAPGEPPDPGLGEPGY
jgi:hypothetical protein